VIKTDQGPLLVAWRYGLGRSVAFTSDLSGKWGKDWVRWDQYGKFSAQLVKWAQRKETQTKYDATVHRKGEEGLFAVDVLTDQNRFVNNLKLGVNILFPSKTSRILPLEQTAPGKYQSVFPAEETGEYYFSLFEKTDDSAHTPRADPPQVFGFGMPYTDEFIRTDVNRSLLQQLAGATQGEMISLDHIPPDLFDAGSGVKKEGTPLWPFFVGAFLFFLLVDVAVRKLVNLEVG
jgi:hypothetical protein